jgi:hypothetical protein
MADDPPYVFRDQSPELIEQHYRRLTTFTGYSEAELAGAEERLGVQFPTVFRTYLLQMGRSRGDLFRGHDLAGIEDLARFRADAQALMAETDRCLTLPPDAVVFLFHQGYAFSYLRAAGGFDSPVYYYAETDRASRQLAPTFADSVDAELRLAEHNHAKSHEMGGYYKVLYPDGGATDTHPARNSCDRPLGQRRLDGR